LGLHHGNANVAIFHLKLGKMQSKKGGVIGLTDNGGNMCAPLFLFVGE
jgi:hypothetical protein